MISPFIVAIKVKMFRFKRTKPLLSTSDNRLLKTKLCTDDQ